MNPNLFQIMLKEYEIAQRSCEGLIKRQDEIFGRYLTGIAFLIPGLCFVAIYWPDTDPSGYATDKSRTLAYVTIGISFAVILITYFTLRSFFMTLKDQASAWESLNTKRRLFEEMEPTLRGSWHPMRQSSVKEKRLLVHWFLLCSLAGLFAGILIYACFLTYIDFKALTDRQAVICWAAGLFVGLLLFGWIILKRRRIIKKNSPDEPVVEEKGAGAN